MATLSRKATQYRDGVFSAASPAPRYGSLMTSFEDGSLGSVLDTDAAQVLDVALEKVIQSLQPDGLQSRALPPEALVAAATAVALAKEARAATEIDQKLTLATAASYAAAFFGLPRNTLLYTVDQVFGMFALTAAQRRQFHQDAARLLDAYVASLKKGSSMSGVFRDGVLGSVYRDGVLGRIMHQNGALRDGSLGAIMPQPGAFQDGALGRTRTRARMMRRPLRGLGGGCGCAGIGTDAAVAPETPFYKKPVVIGGAAIALGVVLYAVTRK